MSFNLLQTTKELFNNEIVSRASALLGENPGSTQRAVDAAIPAVGAALIDKSSTLPGAQQLLNLIQQEHSSGNYVHNILAMFEDNGTLLSKGEAVVKSIFGNNTSGVANAVSQYSGIKSSSASAVLAMVSPVIMGLLAKHSNDGKLNSSGFSAFMSNQKNWLTSLIPTGLGTYFTGLGFGSFNAQKNTSPTIPKPAAPAYTTVKKQGNPVWLLPLCIGILLAGALWYFLGMKGCNSDTTNTTDTTAAVIAPDTTTVIAAAKGMIDSITGDYLYNTGKMITITLPDGTALNAGEFSTEAKLVNFLMDKNSLIDTVNGNWFEFTNVRFKTGSAEIMDSSEQQLKNFVLIAKAFPNAKFKIGGYTDNTGDSSLNMNLSEKRAEAVFAKTIALGASKTSLTGAKGYGPQYPVGDNTTAEGRAMNRRVAINVKAK